MQSSKLCVKPSNFLSAATASTTSTASCSDASDHESPLSRRRKAAPQGGLLSGGEAGAPAPKPTSDAAKFCKAFPQAAGDGDQAATDEHPSASHTSSDSLLGALSVPYFTLPWTEGACRLDLRTLLVETPLPVGSAAFSSVHVVACQGSAAQAALAGFRASAEAIGKGLCVHQWPPLELGSFEGEYAALFHVASDLVLQGADRSSLIVFLADTGEETEMAVASLLGMLPFRGVQVAFVSPHRDYVDPLRTLRTASGLFEYTAMQPRGMGQRPLAAIFGPLPSRTFRRELAQRKPPAAPHKKPQCPPKPPAAPHKKPAPIKINGLDLPMVTFQGQHSGGVKRLAQVLTQHFGSSMFPVVSAGRKGDAPGYGSDILAALQQCGCPGHYFANDSGETLKRPEASGKAELLNIVAVAKGQGRHVVMIVVCDGVNNSAIGMLAAMTGAGFVEVPATLMCHHAATASAKRASSPAVDAKALSKTRINLLFQPS